MRTESASRRGRDSGQIVLAFVAALASTTSAAAQTTANEIADSQLRSRQETQQLVLQLKNGNIVWDEITVGHAGPRRFEGAAGALKEIADSARAMFTDKWIGSEWMAGRTAIEELSGTLREALNDDERWIAAHVLLSRLQGVKNERAVATSDGYRIYWNGMVVVLFDQPLGKSVRREVQIPRIAWQRTQVRQQWQMFFQADLPAEDAN